MIHVKWPRAISCHIPSHQVSLVSLYSWCFQVWGQLVIPLDEINFMLVSLTTIANLPGSIFSNTNLKCSKDFMNFNNLLKDNLIEKFSLQSDWGGEYEKLNSFFSKIGITHLVSCPHAHQQNGAAERKHRHIVEVGLFLLAQSSMPLKYWDKPS